MMLRLGVTVRLRALETQCRSLHTLLLKHAATMAEDYARHFERFGHLADQIKKLEKRVSDLENGRTEANTDKT